MIRQVSYFLPDEIIDHIKWFASRCEKKKGRRVSESEAVCKLINRHRKKVTKVKPRQTTKQVSESMFQVTSTPG